MTPCAKCNTLPTLQQEEFQVFYECETCPSTGSRYNRMSDDYAFTNAERSWDRAQRYSQELIRAVAR